MGVVQASGDPEDPGQLSEDPGSILGVVQASGDPEDPGQLSEDPGSILGVIQASGDPEQPDVWLLQRGAPRHEALPGPPSFFPRGLSLPLSLDAKKCFPAEAGKRRKECDLRSLWKSLLELLPSMETHRTGEAYLHLNAAIGFGIHQTDTQLLDLVTAETLLLTQLHDLTGQHKQNRNGIFDHITRPFQEKNTGSNPGPDPERDTYLRAANTGTQPNQSHISSSKTPHFSADPAFFRAAPRSKRCLWLLMYELITMQQLSQSSGNQSSYLCSRA